MRRAAPALWLLLAIIAAVSMWLFGPCERLAGPGGTSAEPSGEAASGGEREASLERVQAPSGSRAEAPERLVPDAAVAVFRIVDAAGLPVRPARILIARDEALLLDAVSDASGAISLAADGKPAQLVAHSAVRPMEQWAVRVDAGLHELRLGRAAVVSGRLTHADGSAAGGLDLQLSSDHPLLPADPVQEIVWSALGLEPSQAVVLLGETSEDGSFDFPGLPTTWVGSLWIPGGWRVRSSSFGAIEPLTGTVRLERPVEGLLIVLAARATLRGRLLGQSDGTPLAGATLSARLSAPGADSPEFLQAQADAEGRFELASQEEQVSALDLRLCGTFGECPSLLKLEDGAVPRNGELGDLYVERVRNVPFLLHAPDGAPIPGGTAVAAGTRSEPTGRDGRSVLRWLPESVQRLRAEARGFVPAEVELGAQLPDPLRIELSPGNTLEVHVVPPEGGNVRQFKVVVRREAGVTDSPIHDRLQQRAHVGEWASATVDLWNAPPASYLVAAPDEASGVALFRSLAVGVPLELEVRGLTGSSAYHRRTLAPLRAGEKRRIEVLLQEGLVIFRGRVVDAEGRPLAQAMLQIGSEILGWTDEQGAFLCFLVDPKPRTLVVQHEACSTLFLHDYVVPAGEVELRLRPARKVTIEVVDEAGAGVPEAEVWILQEGFTTNTHRIEGNRHLATSLTDNPFQIEVRVGGRKYVQEHSSAVSEARVVVPVHGSVVARLSEATTSARVGRLRLILQPVEGQAGDALVETRSSAPGLTIEISAVPPGRYEASLQYIPTDDERAAGREEETSHAQTITVEAARRAEIRFDLE